MLDPSPCSPECPQRNDICHAHCDIYDKWQKRHKKQLEDIRKKRDMSNEVDGFLADQNTRRRRKTQDDYKQRQKERRK